MTTPAKSSPVAKMGQAIGHAEANQLEGSILGHAVMRREDPTLLRGEENYLDDLVAPNMAAVHFVRSTRAHAKLKSIDTSAALAQPGVAGVWTHENSNLPPLSSHDDAVFERPPLAKDKVRFVGDIIAAIVAETAALASDAADLVKIEYDPLEVVVETEAKAASTAGDASASDRALLFDKSTTNQTHEIKIDNPNALDGSHHIATVELESQRLASVPLETNACLAIPEEGRLHFWVPSQDPVTVKRSLDETFSWGEDYLRVVAPEAVGGGFGAKAGNHVEYIVVCSLAKQLGRPLKWVASRSENLFSLGHGRAMKLKAQLGLDSDNKFTGLDVEVVADSGAYPGVGAVLIDLTCQMSQGVYQIPKINFNGSSTLTNTTHTTAYRGAGRPEATQILERVIDVAADELGVDPAELRSLNFVTPEQFPYTTVGGSVYDSGEYEKALRRALKNAGYESLRTEQAARRAQKGEVQIGIGVSSYVEVTAPGSLCREFGSIKVNLDGTVTATVGTSAHGQGHLTAFSMIVAETLGVDLDEVELVQSDSDQIPKAPMRTRVNNDGETVEYSPRRAAGTMGSRSLQTAGSAIHIACNRVLEQAQTLASKVLQSSEANFRAENGRLVSDEPGSQSLSISWAELAEASMKQTSNSQEFPPLASEVDFDGEDSTYPFGSHVAVVEVDTQTGEVELVRHIAVDDCGTILNPMLVRGQQHGGLAQGAAQALFEEVRYNSDGELLTDSLASYKMPSAADFPSFETSNIETRSPRNPLGAKGIGESATIGSTPAIQNAVVDAVSHLGVKHIDMPLTPENVWRAIDQAST